jgi:hypothetical protein
VVYDGVEQNLSPSPSRDWKIFGGVKMVQRLWQTRFLGPVGCKARL